MTLPRSTSLNPHILSTFSSLTRKSTVPMVQATDVEQYVLSPIYFWCKLHAPPEAEDAMDPFQQRLFDVGRDHQAAVINGSYQGAVEQRYWDEDDGFLRTLGLMGRGVRHIKNMPLLSRPLGLGGRPDVLVRVDDTPSGLGDYSYCVVEIKSARHIKRAHILQGAAYNRLLGLAQGQEHQEFYMVNRDADVQAYQMADYFDALDETLRRMREVIAGKRIYPVYGGGRWPWEGYVDRLAIEASDVSLVPGIGAARRQAIVDAGYATVDGVATAREESLTEIRGVGETSAGRFMTSAQSIVQGSPVRRAGAPTLPLSGTVVFFDLEGTDHRIEAEGLQVANYLIGALVRPPSGADDYMPFFAPSYEDEESNLVAFFQWAASLDDTLFYHWGRYDRTHLSRMAAHYGLTHALSAPTMDRLVDLSPVATGAFAYPAYGEGLKDIAASLGFAWRQKEVSALTSIALYHDYVGSGGSDRAARQKVLDYNEDDCRATAHIYDWLLSQ